MYVCMYVCSVFRPRASAGPNLPATPFQFLKFPAVAAAGGRRYLAHDTQLTHTLAPRNCAWYVRTYVRYVLRKQDACYLSPLLFPSLPPHCFFLCVLTLVLCVPCVCRNRVGCSFCPPSTAIYTYPPSLPGAGKVNVGMAGWIRSGLTGERASEGRGARSRCGLLWSVVSWLEMCTSSSGTGDKQRLAGLLGAFEGLLSGS
jgi:hypothetical protein